MKERLEHLRWMLRRAARMSPAEVAHRITEQRAKKHLTSLHGRLPLELHPKPGNPRRLDPGGLLDSADPAYCAECWKDAREGPSAYGHRWPRSASGHPAWHSFLSGRSTAGIDCFKVPYRNAECLDDDIRLLWEINRLTWLIPIAAHSTTADDKDASGFVVRTVDDFLTTDRVGDGARWNSMIELAMQALSLIVIDSLMRGAPEWEKLVPRLAASLVERKRWLEALPSLHSSANNHRLAELAALLTVSEWIQAKGGDPRALLDEFTTEATCQFDGEGFNRELSFDYHTFSFDLIMTIVELAGGSRHSGLVSLSRRIGSVTSRVEQHAGTWPRIGDSDEACLISSLATPESRPSWLAAMAMGEAQPGSVNGSGVMTLAEGGYSFVVSRDDGHEMLLVADHGQLGYGAIAAHGHADTMGIWAWIDGVPRLIDAGTYSYHSQPAMRDLLRSSGMHNSITVGGAGTSVPDGPFLWNPKRTASHPSFSVDPTPNGTLITMACRLPRIPRVRPACEWHRSVLAAGLGMEIEDIVDSSSPTELSQHFVLGKGFDVVHADSSSGTFVFQAPDSGRIDFRVEGPIGGYRIDDVEISESYGQLAITKRLTIDSVHSTTKPVIRTSVNFNQ